MTRRPWSDRVLPDCDELAWVAIILALLVVGVVIAAW